MEPQSLHESVLVTSNPVLDLLMTQESVIRETDRKIKELGFQAEQSREIAFDLLREEMTPLSKQFCRLPNFDLSPSVLIDIWNFLIDKTNLYQRYKLAALITSTYITRGSDRADVLNIPSELLSTGEINTTLAANELQVINGRLITVEGIDKEISASLTSSTDPNDIRRELLENMRNGAGLVGLSIELLSIDLTQPV